MKAGTTVVRSYEVLARLTRVLWGLFVLGVILTFTLAIWVGEISDVNEGPAVGRGAALETLLWRIPAIALGLDPASRPATVVASAYLGAGVATLVTTGLAIITSLVADRFRGRLRPARHRR